MPDVWITALAAVLVALIGSGAVGGVIVGRRASVRKANAEAASKEAAAKLAIAQARRADAETEEIYDRVTLGQFRELEAVVKRTQGLLTEVRADQVAELERHTMELAAWKAHVVVLEEWIAAQKPPPPPDRPNFPRHN